MLKLDEYRDVWLAEGVNDSIGFFPREFYCLDNYSAFKIGYKGFIYGTVEEAYQASAFMDVAEDVVQMIQKASSPYEAKQISIVNKNRKKADWNDRKIIVMEELLREKINQHPYVKEMLLKTKDYLIVEDSPKDKFWGIGLERDGENNMGKLWMKIRNEIRLSENMDKLVIFKGEVLKLTRFYMNNKPCLWIMHPHQINMPHMYFVGGYANEYCILLEDLTQEEIASIVLEDGSKVYLRNIV